MRARAAVAVLGVAGLLAVLLGRTPESPAPPPAVRAPESAAAPAPEPRTAVAEEVVEPSPAPTSGPGAREILARLLARRAGVTPSKMGKRAYSRFGYERTLLLTEARLLARAYPAESEILASDLALDASRPPSDRRYAISLLGFLAADGRPGAAALLIRLGADPDLDVRELAVDALYRGDAAGAHRSFYLDQCRDANRAAFRAIARDPSTAGAVRELLPGDAGPIRGERRLMAEDALRKFDVLLSPDGNAKLAERLANGGDEWALAAAKAREMPGLQEILRDRLNRVMDLARQKHKFWSDENLKEEIQTAPFEERYILHRGSDVMPDFLYDDLLLAYRDGGGVLSDLERRRLREFGYEGDPKTLLRALVPAGE